MGRVSKEVTTKRQIYVGPPTKTIITEIIKSNGEWILTIKQEDTYIQYKGEKPGMLCQTLAELRDALNELYEAT